MSTSQHQMRKRSAVLRGMMTQMRITPPSQRTLIQVMQFCGILVTLVTFYLPRLGTEDEDEGEEESEEESGKDWDELEEEAKKGLHVLILLSVLDMCVFFLGPLPPS